MGVYHLAGLGRSIGAVTAAFSYLSARKTQAGVGEDDPLFAASGEARDEAGTRGSVEALVLFTTEEIIKDQLRCEKYRDNLPGSTRGSEHTNQSIHKILKNTLRDVLSPLARIELRGNQSGTKPLLIYWCEYQRNRPIQTFERVAQVLYALKPPGRVGKEVWINLTGGSNIINGALQLAASLTGYVAKQYYILSEDSSCLRHTTPLPLLGTKNDTFWVNLPLVFLGFNPVQDIVLDLLVTFAEDGPLTLDDLHKELQAALYRNPRLQSDPANDRDVFIHGTLRPLQGHGLVEAVEDEGQWFYKLGPSWDDLARYLQALPSPDDRGAPQSLSALAQMVSWLTKEELELD